MAFKISKASLRSVVVITLFVAEGGAAALAVFDGNELLKVFTPMVSMVLGWLFTSSFTGNQATDEEG